MKNRILAVFLIAAMVIGLCPQTVYAVNETGQTENSQQTTEQGEGYQRQLKHRPDQECRHMVPAFLKNMMPEA